MAVEEFRQQYLENIRDIAADSMNWDNIGPTVSQFRELLLEDVEKDTRKLTTNEAFRAATSTEPIDPDDPGATGLRVFFEKRSEYLLSHPEVKALLENE